MPVAGQPSPPPPTRTRAGEPAVLQDALSTVAVTTMFALAMVDLHVELVAGAVAWLAAWWLLREPAV